MHRKRVGVAFLSCLLFAATTHAADRFTRIVEEGGEATVTAGGFIVNQKRVAVQKEISVRPPTGNELGVQLPPGSKLMPEQTARQIAQYHPVWRIYQYSLAMPRGAVIAHFEGQGLSYDPQSGNLKFAGPDGEFVDGLSQSDQHQIRIWRKPQ